MIEIKNLKKSYGDTVALDGLNLTISDKTTFGLTGINGSGKSTLLRLISGVMKADEGEIIIDGENVFENESIKSKMFFLPDDPFYDKSLTAKDVVRLYSTFFNFNNEKFQKIMLDFKLNQAKALRTFSKGMRRQVFLAAAICTSPKYLLIDEAFDGLDPYARLYFKRELIALCNDFDATVIIASHSLRELEDISESYAMLENKRVGGAGVLQDSLDRYYKLQVAFEEMPSLESFSVLNAKAEVNGHVLTIVGKDNKEEIMTIIKSFNPLFIDEIKLGFEEMFIFEAENGGLENA